MKMNKPPVQPSGDKEKIEAAIRGAISKPEGELTQADFDQVTKLYLSGNEISETDIETLKVALPNCEIKHDQKKDSKNE